MEGESIRKIGAALIVVGVIGGILAGNISSNEFGDFNAILMLIYWISGILSGFPLVVWGTMVENQEKTNMYLEKLINSIEKGQ